VADRLRVLHVPGTVGGNPQGLARAERALGVDSVSVALVASPFGYRPDRVLREPPGARLRFELRRARLLIEAMTRYDVVHFNFGRTIVPRHLRMLDLPLLRKAGVAIAVTFQGDDVRRGDVARALPGRPTLPVALPHLYSRRADRERNRRAERFGRYADLIYYLNPDLRHVLPERARFLPYAHVEPSEWLPTTRSAAEPPVIVHAPSDREVKGTNTVVAAVQSLRDDGMDVTLRLVEGVPHDVAVGMFRDADLAVDQLHAGFYGGFAVEAMAVGLPVLASIRTEDLDVLPDEMARELPVIDVTPATLRDVIRDLLGRPRGELRELGARSRSFVERWHDPRRIAAGLIDDYTAVVSTRRR
jgi:glycosyltransferase involved in cell wall biosynthesis